MVAIIDYGVGNLFSLVSSFSAINVPAEITSDPEKIRNAGRIILPGVGAFEDAALKLKESGMEEIVKEEAAKGKPLMGICLGMQLLLEKSYEYGEHEGLGLVKGNVRPIAGVIDPGIKIPQIGWNSLKFEDPSGSGRNSPIFKYINEGDYVYFVHSYYCADCEKSTIATTEYSVPLTAAVQRENVYGCQFHPEKSGSVGLKILKAFSEL